jgi:hypothetical protein
MPEAGLVPPPYALALGICDLIYRDRSTGKRFILAVSPFCMLQIFQLFTRRYAYISI